MSRRKGSSTDAPTCTTKTTRGSVMSSTQRRDAMPPHERTATAAQCTGGASVCMQSSCATQTTSPSATEPADARATVHSTHPSSAGHPSHASTASHPAHTGAAGHATHAGSASHPSHACTAHATHVHASHACATHPSHMHAAHPSATHTSHVHSATMETAATEMTATHVAAAAAEVSPTAAATAGQCEVGRADQGCGSERRTK